MFCLDLVNSGFAVVIVFSVLSHHCLFYVVPTIIICGFKYRTTKALGSVQLTWLVVAENPFTVGFKL